MIFQGDRDAELGLDTFHSLRSQLRNVVRTEPPANEIDVWLESQGGDVHVAYKIALLLRTYAAKIRVVVPDCAKSAATLLTLSADEIFMAPAAELGPLDAQLYHEPEGVILSALDISKSVQRTSEAALAFAVEASTRFLQDTALSTHDAMKWALKLSTELHESLIAKMHPAHISDADNHLRATVKYANNLLEMRNLCSADGACAGFSAETLVRDYPQHGFVVDISEAIHIGLPIRPLIGYPCARAVHDLHDYMTEHRKTVLEVRAQDTSRRQDGTGITGTTPSPMPLEPSEPLEPETTGLSLVGKGPDLPDEENGRGRRLRNGRATMAVVKYGRHASRRSRGQDGMYVDIRELTSPESEATRRERAAVWAKAAREGR